MKQFFFLFALVGFYSGVGATTYYSQGSLAPDQLSSWNSSRTGAGTAPVSFTTAGDIFIIQAGDTMITSTTWTIGGAGNSLQLEDGAVLQGNHGILLTGQFLMNNGATYIHNNKSSVSSSAGASIFGGTESFSANSTVEIRDWINSATALPTGINWGNLVLNYSGSLGGNWQQNGALSAIQGNLLVKATGGASFLLAHSSVYSGTIAGNLQVTGGTLILKDDHSNTNSAVLQVLGNISCTGGTLNTGEAQLYGYTELRFKGNLSQSGTGAITATDEYATLVVNGTTVQVLTMSGSLSTNLKVVPGAILNLESNLAMASSKVFVLAGTCNAGNYNVSFAGNNQFIVSGGNYSGSGNVNMANGNCQVCQGSGSFSVGSWCAASGNTGVFTLTGGHVIFDQSLASVFDAGVQSSSGEVYLKNGASISFTGTVSGPFPNRGTLNLNGNGVLSMDEYSLAEGNASYFGSGGKLILGASGGIALSGTSGNIQVTGGRNYDYTGINSFEYSSSLPQATGDGLPATIDGSLTINNNSGFIIYLNQATTIDNGGSLNLVRGILKTTNTFLLTLRRLATLTGGGEGTFVDGPLRKIGEQSFNFPVGKNSIYSPVYVESIGGSLATDVFTVEYVPANPIAAYGDNRVAPIDHISSVEYWIMSGPSMRSKRLTFNFYDHSQVGSLSALIGGYFDGVYWVQLFQNQVTGTPTGGTITVNASNYGPITLASTAPPNIICPGGSTQFVMQSPGAGYSYQWQVNTGSGFTNISDDAVYQNSGTNKLTFNGVPSSFAGYQYRCVATNGGSTVYGDVITIKFLVTWTGAVDNVWENPMNWNCGIIPDQYTDVYISANSVNQPVVNSNVTLRSIVVFSGASVVVNSGFTFKVLQ